jgi:hypothetical protein
VLEQLSAQPTESIPAASGTWADTKAAYRLFDNDRVDAVDILDGHSRATLQRIAGEPVVLLVQDTTFLSDIRDLQGRGVGTLRLTKRAEYLLHPSVAFSASRVNLGVLGHHFWQRPEERTGRRRECCLLEEKESYRWLLGYDMACALQALNPHTLVVNVADREGDIYEWLLAGEFDERVPDRAGYLIRAKCNRRVAPGENGSLGERLAQVPVLGHTTVSLKRRPGRRARVATLHVRARTVTFHRTRRRGRNPAPVTVTAVYAREARPLAGEPALEWMLLTNLPVESFAAAQRLIGWDQARWEIELYFRILKQGCRIEDLRLETAKRLERCIAVYLIVAWRLHYLTQIARAQATAPCSQAFSPAEWQTIYVLQKKQAPPKQPPSMRATVRMLARLGGFLARKGDGEPGPETLWRGFKVLRQSMRALEITAALDKRE